MTKLPMSYDGPLDRKKMDEKTRIAYESFCSLKARSKKQGLPKPTFTAREFIGWWLNELKSFKGDVATCGRIDHSKGYSWDNMFMQDMAENSREGMLRNKTNLKTAIKYGKKILVRCKKTNEHIATISSIRSAAKLFDVSQRLIQYLVKGNYKKSNKINFKLEVA